MEFDFSQDEPKLVLTYPHKSKFIRISFVVIILLNIIAAKIMNHLISNGTDFSDKISIVIMLICIPMILLILFFLGYYSFINAVKLEIYENNVVKYYIPGGRGHSALQFKFELKDIEQIKMKKRPFNCLKLVIKIKNPVFYGLHEKKLNKLVKVSVITGRKESESFMQQVKKLD